MGIKLGLEEVLRIKLVDKLVNEGLRNCEVSTFMHTVYKTITRWIGVALDKAARLW